VKLEKTQQNLRMGVESFDRTALKPTDTVEKDILPGTEGKPSHQDSQIINHHHPFVGKPSGFLLPG